jgi:hypothetical protein
VLRLDCHANNRYEYTRRMLRLPGSRSTIRMDVAIRAGLTGMGGMRVMDANFTSFG